MKRFINDYRIELLEDEAHILFYFGDNCVVDIPSEFEGRPVTVICKEAFIAGKTNPVPQDRTANGRKACVPVREIHIPRTVRRLDGAFSGCEELEQILLPASVNEITEDCFHLCRALRWIDVDPANPVFVSENGCLYSKGKDKLIRCPSALPAVSSSLLENVHIIGASAFEFCRNLEEIDIPGTVTTVENFAFANCKELWRIGLHPDITFEGAGHFWCCEVLEAITFYNRAETVPASCFYQCKRLTSFFFGSPVKSIEDYAFSGCGIETLALPKGTKKIKQAAFQQCLKLREITIPKSVSSFSKNDIFNGVSAGSSRPINAGSSEPIFAGC